MQKNTTKECIHAGCLHNTWDESHSYFILLFYNEKLIVVEALCVKAPKKKFWYTFAGRFKLEFFKYICTQNLGNVTNETEADFSVFLFTCRKLLH